MDLQLIMEIKFSCNALACRTAHARHHAKKHLDSGLHGMQWRDGRVQRLCPPSRLHERLIQSRSSVDAPTR